MNAKQVGLIASIVLAVVLTAAVSVFLAISGYRLVWYVHLLFFVFSFAVFGMALRFLYGRFIYENLNQIYKHILRLRNPKNVVRPPDKSSSDITTQINSILIDWSNESKEEIDHLKQVENYRRDFLSNVSHELKTPIFSVQGYIHTLIDGGIDDPDVNLHYLNKASKSIDRLISIVDDLESISRLEAGELIVEYRTFDLGELVRDVVESLEFQAKEKNIKLEVSASPDKPIYVYADKDMVRQVLVNLLVNSVKYGNAGGLTEVRFTEDEDKVIVDVADNGIGISKLHLPRLFERFYRVDKSRSREQGGTGLGLAIVKHIMEAHGENIHVNSEPGQGTVFTFSLRKSK
ncbi:MAG: sensor histidine kinase [Bacteroidia bacterium]|nr:sensor histidine kinase [Bacteroidia bacterium]